MDHRRGTDQQLLRESQYRDASNLDARSAIYAYGEGATTLQEIAVALVGEGLSRKRILDVGCGPGNYASSFAAAATYVGLDLSRGMLEESRTRHQTRCLGVADAQQLPISDAAFDVVLAMHMLYHVPDRAQAIAELARVVRSGGRVLVATNGRKHQIETSDVIAAAFHRVVGHTFDAVPVGANFPLEEASDELGVHFACEVHATDRTLTVPVAAPVLAYIASMPEYVGIDDPATWKAFAAAAEVLIEERIASEGAFTITASAGVIACQPL